MEGYIVITSITTFDGKFAEVKSHTYYTLAEAEETFYSFLGRNRRIKTYASHSAIILAYDGTFIRSDGYTHEPPLPVDESKS
jgi:hypothetical protein